jgi:hypothetical protein
MMTDIHDAITSLTAHGKELPVGLTPELTSEIDRLVSLDGWLWVLSWAMLLLLLLKAITPCISMIARFGRIVSCAFRCVPFSLCC